MERERVVEDTEREIGFNSFTAVAYMQEELRKASQLIAKVRRSRMGWYDELTGISFVSWAAEHFRTGTEHDTIC